MTHANTNGGLGFKDLEVFNVALLDRQAWRLLTKPDTFYARLLKAVYFPDKEILDADLGSHPFQVWRGILEGKEALKLGLIKRIGDDSSTSIWHDSLLPRDHNLRHIACLSRVKPGFVVELI